MMNQWGQVLHYNIFDLRKSYAIHDRAKVLMDIVTRPEIDRFHGAG